MKKNVMCIALAAILLVMAIPAFAEGRAASSASYSAGKVKHFFNTSNTISKVDTEVWVSITDTVSYNRYCNEKTNAVSSESAYHITYLADYLGNKLSAKREIYSASSSTFSGSALGNAGSVELIKLKIYNPKESTYDTGDSSQEYYLQTGGSFRGVTKVAAEASAVTPTLGEQ